MLSLPASYIYTEALSRVHAHPVIDKARLLERFVRPRATRPRVNGLMSRLGWSTARPPAKERGPFYTLLLKALKRWELGRSWVNEIIIHQAEVPRGFRRLNHLQEFLVRWGLYCLPNFWLEMNEIMWIHWNLLHWMKDWLVPCAILSLSLWLQYLLSKAAGNLLWMWKLEMHTHKLLDGTCTCIRRQSDWTYSYSVDDNAISMQS